MPALLTTNAHTATASIATTSNNNNHDIDRSVSLSTSPLPVSSTTTTATTPTTTTSTLQTQNTHAACSPLRRISTPASLSPSPFEVASLSSLPLHASSSFCSSTPSSLSFSCAQSPYSSSCATLSSPIADLSSPQPATALLPSSHPPTLPTSLSQQQQHQQQQQQQRALPLQIQQYLQQQQTSTLTSSPMQIAGSALTGCSASPSETENLSGLVLNLNATPGSNGPTATAKATASTTEAATTPESTASPSASDIVQHCLLFPTYATRHSRSGSKDPDDWNIRVRGWAFSKRSNRRKRLVMSVARKIAGVTKDSKVYETLESRFGMFLASNTQGAQFMVQCVGLASTTRMELAEGSDSMSNPTVNVLLDEIKSSESEGGLADTEATSEQDIDHQSLEQDQSDSHMRLAVAGRQESIQPPLQHAAITALKLQLPEQVQKSVQEEQRKQLHDAAQLHDVDNQTASTAVDHLDAGVHEATQIDTSVGSIETESRFSARLSRGTALFKNVVRKVKTSTSVYSSNNGASTDSLRLSSGGMPANNNSVSDFSSADESSRPMVVTRAASGASILTRLEDLGRGVFPTVQVASRPGGHFDGTLRMGSGEVEAHRSKDTDTGHPRFLKLHAHHVDMPDTCHGVVNLIDPEGVSVISDIDDTIKDTNVTAGARIILRNTFLKDMMEVEGMASVYKRWWTQGAAIHYVSNSPWQLIPSLLEFFQTHMFPPGSAHLRLHDNVLKTYFTAPGENKRRSIREILTDFPDRKFILVGDSGEIDMEIYTEMALEFPGQIVKIFIRDITTARLKEIVSKMPPTRSLSFSSLLLPKTPLGFFSRRGSNTNTIGSVTSNNNASTSNVATMSSTDDDSDNDNDNDGDDDDEDIDHNHADNEETFESRFRGELSDFKLERPRYPNYGRSMSPRLDPSGPFTPPTMSLSTTPTSSTASSPRLQAKQITAAVKAVFGSTFRRSSPNNNNNNSSNNSKQAALDGWNSLRKRTGSMSPASPLSEGVAPMTGYPFPRVGSPASSSMSSLNGRQQQHQQRSRRNDDAYNEEVYGRHSNLSTHSFASSSPSQAVDKSLHEAMDIFDDEDHQHVMFQQQQQQRQPRQRTNTFSFTPVTTNSPPRSPMIPIRRTTGYVGRQEPHPLEMAMTATSPVDTYLDNGRRGVLEPQSISPSPSLSSSPTSIVATTPNSFTNPKNPLEIWLERVQQCRRRLPKGMLTLFESAEELEQCEIVQEVFKKYGGDSSSHDQKQGQQQQQPQQHHHHHHHSQQPGSWTSETNDEKGADIGQIDGAAFDAQSEFSTEMNLISRSATSIATTTTTTTTSSWKTYRDSISAMTTSVKSFSVSSRTNTDYIPAMKHREVNSSQHGRDGYSEPSSVEGILKSFVSN